MLTRYEFIATVIVIAAVIVGLGVMMLWLYLRYHGDPNGYRPQQKAKKPPRWRGRPLSPAEWQALRERGMSEVEIAEVDKAARWAGR